jgi:hypothetical protein
MTLNRTSGILASWGRLKARFETITPGRKLCFYLACIAIGFVTAGIVDLAITIITHNTK